MPAGRPTTYSEEMLNKTREYLEAAEDEEVQELTGLSAKGTELYRNKLKVNIPTIEGLAYYIKTHKDTIYEWCKEHPEYSDVINELRAKQANALISKGLSGDYNSTIAKVLLTKHGYREGIETDLTSKGDKISSGISEEVLAQADTLLREKKLNKDANA